MYLGTFKFIPTDLVHPYADCLFLDVTPLEISNIACKGMTKNSKYYLTPLFLSPDDHLWEHLDFCIHSINPPTHNLHKLKNATRSAWL